jgi:hypothetical protein
MHIIINWQRSMTIGILILPAGGRAWYPVMSHSLHNHFRYFWMVCSPWHLTSAVVKTPLHVWFPCMCSYNY